MATSKKPLPAAVARDKLQALVRTASDASRRADTMKQQVRAAKAALKDMRKAAKAARKAAKLAAKQVAAAKLELRAATASAPARKAPAPRKASAKPASRPQAKPAPKLALKRMARLHPAAAVARSVIRRLNAATRKAAPVTIVPPAPAAAATPVDQPAAA